ncbi:MAG: hypothetical protein ACTSYI_00265, partial [Promethearchaeota archaeon]
QILPDIPRSIFIGSFLDIRLKFRKETTFKLQILSDDKKVYRSFSEKNTKVTIMAIHVPIESSVIPSIILRKDVFVECPICHESIEHKIDLSTFKSEKNYPVPHLVLHGDPLHGIILYIDARGKVRAVESVKSVQQI